MSEEVAFGVKGMSCAACVSRVERVLSKQPGVTNAAVNLATERVTVTLEEGARLPACSRPSKTPAMSRSPAGPRLPSKA